MGTGLDYLVRHILSNLGERVQVDRQILSELEIVRYTEQLRPIAAELGKSDPNFYPTFFEFVAAIAFLKFARASVDIACIETGLGGRLDATNVVDPELSMLLPQLALITAIYSMIHSRQ